MRDLRVAEVVKLDLQLDAKGKVEAYRAKVKVSFKFEGLGWAGYGGKSLAYPTSRDLRHCERKREAIHLSSERQTWIASLRSQ